MSRLTAAALLLLCSLPLLRAAGSADSDVIARVGNIQVTAGDIRAAMANLDAKTQAAAANDPSALSQVVRALLTQRLVLQEALAKKWDQDPAVTAALARMRDTAIAQSYLESVSKPPATYPSDAQLQAAYDANKGQLLLPRQYRLAQIYIKCPKGSDSLTASKAQVKLEAVRRALGKRSADFAAIATAESDDATSAAKGGEIGWVAENRIQPEIRAQFGSLVRGTVSQPVRLEDGWHILKVLEVKEPYTPSLDEIRSQLIQQMRAQQARANSQAYLAKLLQDHPIEINELSLPDVLKAP